MCLCDALNPSFETSSIDFVMNQHCDFGRFSLISAMLFPSLGKNGNQTCELVVRHQGFDEMLMQFVYTHFYCLACVNGIHGGAEVYFEA